MTQKPLTIVQVLPEMSSGGVEVCTLETARALVEAGHRSIVISSGGPLVKELETNGSKHITMPVHKKSPGTLFQAAALRREFCRVNADIVHARSRVPAWVCRLALFAFPNETRPGFVTTVHGLYSVSKYSSVMTSGDRVIAVSETVRRYILDNYPGYSSRSVETIPHGVDPKSFPYGFVPDESWVCDFRKQFPETVGKRLVTLPGRLTRLKGHFDFLEAIGSLPETVHGLIVGGEDPRRAKYAAELRDAVVDRGLADRVTLTGHRSDLRNIAAISNVVLSLSTKPEAFGKTTLEAISLGVPVVGYDHGGVSEILNEFFPQGLTPAGDPRSLAKTIEAVLHNKPHIKPNTDWTLEKAMTDELAVYTSLAASRARIAA